MPPFDDYYHVLQVHPDAEWEVVQSAYKRLSRKYHPDVNASPEAREKMIRLNAAYDVLRDAARRRAYHATWLREKGNHGVVRERVVYRETPPKRDEGSPDARNTVYQYFYHLSRRAFKEAFGLICENDRRRFGYASFVEWQEAVAALYEIGRFSVELYKRYDDFKADGVGHGRAEEYLVKIAEKDRKTGLVQEYNFTKFAIWEKGVCRIYLGYRDLTPLVKQFKFMASTKEEAVILGHWEGVAEHTDLETGLPNRNGLLQRMTPEIYRYKRYARPFTLAVFRAELPERVAGAGQGSRVLKYLGYLFSRSIRTIDSAAYLGGGQFGILLAEANRKTAALAARRILRTVSRDVSACFDFDIAFTVGLCAYAGENLEQMVRECLRPTGTSFFEKTRAGML